MEVNNEYKSDSMKEIEKKNYNQKLNLLWKNSTLNRFGFNKPSSGL